MSQLRSHHLRDHSSLQVGKSIPVMRILPKKSKNESSLQVVSNKAAYERTRSEFLSDIAKRIRRGRVELEGTVVHHVAKDGVVDGAILRVDELNTAYVRRKDASFNRTDRIEDVLPIGLTLTTRVVDVDLKNLKLQVSTREATIPHDAIAR